MLVSHSYPRFSTQWWIGASNPRLVQESTIYFILPNISKIMFQNITHSKVINEVLSPYTIQGEFYSHCGFGSDRPHGRCPVTATAWDSVGLALSRPEAP